MKIIKIVHSTRNKTTSTDLKIDSCRGEKNDMTVIFFMIVRENSL